MKDVDEDIINCLTMLNVIPSFHHSVLFCGGFNEFIGFQVLCTMNNNGRIRFSCIEGQEKLQEVYLKIFGNEFKKGSSHDVNQKSYPSSGSDFLEDLAPATIIKVVNRFISENEDFYSDYISMISRITEEVDKWRNQYNQLLRKTELIHHSLSQSLERLYSKQ